MTERTVVSEDRRRTRRTLPVLLIGEIVARVKGLLMIPLLTRYFQTAEYGAVAQSSLLVAVLIPLIFLGSESGMARMLPGLDEEDRRRRFTAWFLAISALTLVACVALLGTHRVVERLLFGRAGLYPALIPILAATIAVTVLVNITRGWLRLCQLATALTVATAAQAVLGLAAIAVVLQVNGSVRLLLATSAAADGLVFVGLAVYLTRLGAWARPDLRGIVPIVRYGLPLLPIGYAVWGMNWFDRLVLVDERGLTAVGVYSLAYSIAYFAVQILANPVWILFPYSSAHLYDTGQHGPLRLLFRKSILATWLLVVPFVGLTAVAGRELIEVIAPQRYVPGHYVIPIVMGGYLAQMLAGYYETALGLVYKQWHSTVATVVGLAVNVLINLTLIPSMGMTGAALATLGGFGVHLVYVAVVARQVDAVSTDVGGTARILLAGLAGTAAAVAAHAAVSGADLVVLVATSAAGMVAYSLALLLARVFTVEAGVIEVRSLVQSLRRA